MRRAQRKGVVEAAIKYLTKNWWRTAAVTTSPKPRPASMPGRSGSQTVARDQAERSGRTALTAFEGNHYSAAPRRAGRTVTILARVGEPLLRIISGAGEVIAEHRRAPHGAEQTVRSREHAAQLQQAVLAALRPITAAPASPICRPVRAR